MLDRTLQRRNALFVLFLLPGLGISSWVTRTPDVRDALEASTAEMGMVLFGLSVGSMLGVLSSAPLVGRWGTRPVIAAGMLGVALGSGLIGLGAATSQAVVVTSGLAVFGLGMGVGEVAVNIEGAEVERLLCRSVLPTLHGFFSLGTVAGAVVGMVLTWVGFPVLPHLVLMGLIVLASAVLAARYVPTGVGLRPPKAERTPRDGAWVTVLKDARLLLIGSIILALALAEGTANDWLPLVMVDGHGFGAALGSLVYAMFAASMTAGRFVGGVVVDRFGRSAVLRASTLTGAAGILLVIVAGNQILAAAAVILWGLGASLGFPVALSAAGDSGEDSSARVSFAATIGYVAFLVGPPVLGFLGELVGLRYALIFVLVLVAVVTLATPATGRAKDRSTVTT